MCTWRRGRNDAQEGPGLIMLGRGRSITIPGDVRRRGRIMLGRGRIMLIIRRGRLVLPIGRIVLGRGIIVLERGRVIFSRLILRQRDPGPAAMYDTVGTSSFHLQRFYNLTFVLLVP
jgi:hypothetical protein